MSNKDIMVKFISEINKNKQMTYFIRNILEYKKIMDYNYIFRMTNNRKIIIIDLYDNVSENRFNRYKFHFTTGTNKCDMVNKSNVFITDIYVYNPSQSNNFEKLAYLFSLEKPEMIKYGATFLDDMFIKILKEIINKSI